MKYFKTIFHKLAITSIAIIFAAGCATVTDANADLFEESTDAISSERINNIWDNTTGDDMGEIIIRPDMGE